VRRSCDAENLKLRSDRGDSGINANKSVVGSGGVCIQQESGFSRRESFFTFNLVYKEIL
jgi:hypothetical protein